MKFSHHKRNIILGKVTIWGHQYLYYFKNYSKKLLFKKWRHFVSIIQVFNVNEANEYISNITWKYIYGCVLQNCDWSCIGWSINNYNEELNFTLICVLKIQLLVIIESPYMARHNKRQRSKTWYNTNVVVKYLIELNP